MDRSPMDTMELMKARHSVRRYSGRAIEEGKRKVLDDLASELNRTSSLNIQMVYDEPRCFNSILAHYGRFSGCFNYIAIAGRKSKALDFNAGYYGEQLVLKAQELGLNTCWVAVSHGKCRATVGQGEKLSIVIALGYGSTQGSARRSRSFETVSESIVDVPDWYRTGVEAALLAPTALNQQRFRFRLEDGQAYVRSIGGPFSDIDLGIVKCHFELASGHQALANAL